MVDFTSKLVVAFFQGERLNQTDLVLHNTMENSEAFTLQFVGVYQQTSVRSSFTSHPYHFAIVHQMHKPIVVTFDIRQVIEAPPEWSEQTRLSVVLP